MIGSFVFSSCGGLLAMLKIPAHHFAYLHFCYNTQIFFFQFFSQLLLAIQDLFNGSTRYRFALHSYVDHPSAPEYFLQNPTLNYVILLILTRGFYFLGVIAQELIILSRSKYTLTFLINYYAWLCALIPTNYMF